MGGGEERSARASWIAPFREDTLGWDPGVLGFLCLAVTLSIVSGGLSFPICSQQPWAVMVLKVVSHRPHLIVTDNIKLSTVMK